MGNESSRKLNVNSSKTSDFASKNATTISELTASIKIMNVSQAAPPEAELKVVETIESNVAPLEVQVAGDTTPILADPSEETSSDREVSECHILDEKNEDQTNSSCQEEKESTILEEIPAKLQDTNKDDLANDDSTCITLEENGDSDNVLVVANGDEEKDGAAELVGLFFEADEERVEITTEWSFVEDKDCAHSSDEGPQEKSENSSEENSVPNEPQAYNNYNSSNTCEGSLDGGGGSALVYFSPRDVHNGKVIGEGGFGRVLKGSLHGGTPVAIKLFHAPLAITSELDELFSLKHKNIVTVFGIVHQAEEIDCPQLVLQYMSEGNVLQYLSRHENPEDNSTLGKIALDVVEGCQFLQQQGIVHGNLAARNVLVDKVVGRHKTYYNAKISDIGLIRFAEVSGGNYMKIPGTDKVVPVRWVPKEIIQEQDDGSVGTDFTCKSDVWSFGVLLWEIWTRGAIPYGASYSNLRVMQFLKDDYSPLKVHRPTECPTKIVSLMESIFQVEPNERPTFDQLVEHFKKYRGHGKEHKSKMVTGGGPRGTLKDSPTSPVPPADFAEEFSEYVSQQKGTSRVGEKSTFQKKKKNKKPKKLYHEKPGTDGWSTQSAVGSETAIAATANANNEMEGAAAVLPELTNPNQESSTDSTIVQLLKRVNQLEKERRGGNHSGYAQGRNRGGPHSTNWQKRSGPPRFNRGGRGGYLGKNYNESTTPIQSRSSVVVSPPPSSLAPPPYTEDPLPHHSTSRFSAPLPEYEYDHNPGPSVNRADAPSGRYPGNNGHRNRTVVLDRASGPAQGEEDFIRKIKRLAEEIEFLRAEKMTQELLKKSAELADIMKVVTSERSETMGVAVVENRYSNDGNRAAHPIPSRHLATRGEQYYAGVYDEYSEYGNPPRGDGRWQPEQTGQLNYHQSLRPPMPRHIQHHRGGGVSSNSQRRPYYKGRGGGNGHRGHSNNGRYNGDGSGSYGPGPYGNMQ